jgi:hypothetical protein
MVSALIDIADSGSRLSPKDTESTEGPPAGDTACHAAEARRWGYADLDQRRSDLAAGRLRLGDKLRPDRPTDEHRSANSAPTMSTTTTATPIRTFHMGKPPGGEGKPNQ